MFTTLRQKQSDRYAKLLPTGVLPSAVEWDATSNLPARITFSDGEVSFGSCIHCFHPPCLEFSENELQLQIFQSFPADRNPHVCPTDAISLSSDNEAPAIEANKCIGCGLCVVRCPVRAIYFDGSVAAINDEPNKHFLQTHERVSEETTATTIAKFDAIKEAGEYQQETDENILFVRERIGVLFSTLNAQFPNHLVRNLLVCLDTPTAMRRRGDTNIRMDLVMEPLGLEHGTAEVEFDTNLMIDSPRNILDNFAVLVSRYGIQSDKLFPLIACLELPNQRSEYWRFINDVRSVLEIKINTITVGALVILLWSRTPLLLKNGDELYVDNTSYSIRQNVEQMLGRTTAINQGYPGLLESAK